MKPIKYCMAYLDSLSKAFYAEPYYLGSVNPFAIEKAEQHDSLNKVLRLLDDPQVQQKSVTLLSHRVGQIRGT